MHPALVFQFERAVHEYARWLAVPADDRSAAPAWWWGPALAMRDLPETLPQMWCDLLKLPARASCRTAGELLLGVLQSQTSPTWPDEFPHRYQPPVASG
jgi:hypothetical protein